MKSFTLSLFSLTTLTLALANADLSAQRAAPAGDDRLMRDPVFQTWNDSATVGSIASAASFFNLRPTNIEIVDATTSPPRLAVTSVKNVGEYQKRWRFVYDQTQNGLQLLCDTEGYRIADVERYVTSGVVKFAAILEDNRGVNQKTWRWMVGYTFANLQTVWQANDMRVVDLERYTSGSTMLCAAVMIENSGRDQLEWNWALNQSAAGVTDFLQARGHRIYDIERQDDGQYDVISVRHDVGVSYWFHVTPTYAETLRQNGNYRLFDLHKEDDGRFTIAMVRNGGFFDSFGTTCDSGFAHNATGNPAPGQAIQFRLSTPSGYVGWVTLLIGVQNTAFDLGAIGAPGCRLLVNPMVSIPLLATGSGASGQLTLPPTLSQIGTSFHTQFLIPQPGANALGLRTSKGLTTTIGPVQ